MYDSRTILAEHSNLLKKTNLFFIFLIISVAFLSGCAKPAMRTSSTYFAPPTQVIPPSQGFYHTIQKGQTLYSISKIYRVDLETIKRANRIYDPSSLEVGQKLFIPQAVAYTSGRSWTGGAGPVSFDQALRIIGPRKNTYFWKTITVHHSGTRQGSARSFERDHKRRKMGGLFYHFVIGNGTSTGDGEIETGFRWRRQIKANRPYDIQICLVGNFDNQEVSSAQMNSLVNLIRAIQQEYRISTGNVRQHCDIPGKHTDCPGKRFPFSRLLSAL